jgi:hypothetical protein
MTPTEKQNLPPGFVLYTEKVTVKLDKHMVVTDNTINRKETQTSIRYMKDVLKMNR